VQVKRRLVIYVQGYDPRGHAEYYRLFRREYRRASNLYGLSGSVSSTESDPDRHITTWNAVTRGDRWQVDTRYVFLRWEDIIRKDFARPAWWKFLHLYRTFTLTLLDGVVARIFHAHWRFGLFLFYPFVLMTFWLLLGGVVGLAAGQLATALGAPALAAAIAGAAAVVATFAALIRFTERQTYLLYLCDDGVSTYQFAHGRRPDWEERLDAFARQVVAEVRASDADEAVIIGHSSGSFLAIDVVDRAFQIDPELGRQGAHNGPPLRLLTIGANLPIVGFHKSAQWFRDRLRRLAVSPDLVWVDYQSRHDVMNFWPFDPISGHGIALGGERRNPLVIPVSFRDLWGPGSFHRRRWRFFDAHFQFLRANEQPGVVYDYYLICCGPVDLVTRATKPSEALSALKPQNVPQEAASG
jgi:hypothetical protein